MENRCDRTGKMLLLKLADGYLEVHYTILSTLCILKNFIIRSLEGKEASLDSQASSSELASF